MNNLIWLNCTYTIDVAKINERLKVAYLDLTYYTNYSIKCETGLMILKRFLLDKTNGKLMSYLRQPGELFD